MVFIEHYPKEVKIVIPADESIKDVFLADPKELVKFVNSVMSTNHDPEVAVVSQLKAEHIKSNRVADGKNKMTYDKVIADMLFSIDGTVYNIEFQTIHDNAILCRIAEYQLSAMIDMVKSTGFANEYEGELPLPRMTIVQLEKSNNVPDYYKLWFVNKETNQKILQEFPIVKIWEYTIDQLSQNGMHLLLPFKIIDIRKNIKGKDMDEDTTARFLEMIAEIDSKIMGLFHSDGLSYTAMEKMYHAHGSLIQYFNDKFISDTNPLKGEVDSMFAEVMDRRKVITKADILREGEAIGEARGKAQGEAIGEARGKAQGEARIRELLNIAANAGASFKAFKAMAEAQGIPEEQYVPMYRVAFNTRSNNGELVPPTDGMSLLKAEEKLKESKKTKTPPTRSRKKDNHEL